MAKPLIEVKDLTVYYGNTRALSNVNLEVEEGEYLGIIGPNGGGKTTLLKCIAGLTKYKTGTISIKDKNIRIGYVPQFSNLDKGFHNPCGSGSVWNDKSKAEALLQVCAKEKDRAYELLEKVGIRVLRKGRLASCLVESFKKC